MWNNSIFPYCLTIYDCRWGFVTHGCIDGYSRLITYLVCSTNNKASTVLKSFVEATLSYGVPSRVRSDYGGENFEVALFMNMIRGADRGSHLTGESVHNQRIERLWRDVNNEVIHPLYLAFYKMEDDGDLDIENSLHLCALQIVFTPEINQRLKMFKNGWNKHKLSSAHNKSPEQLWLTGMLDTAPAEMVEEDTAETLDQALQRYHLTVDQFPSITAEEDGNSPASVSIRQHGLQIAHEQTITLQAMINSVANLSLAEKFLRCKDELAILLNV